MPLNFDASTAKKSLELATTRDDHIYNSETWKNAKDRYEMYRNAYYRKHDSNHPVWKSRLYFPVFFMACKAFEAEVKETLQKPIVNINFTKRGKSDMQLQEKEKLTNYDINNDMYISGFNRTVDKMYWFNEVFGVSVGRETFVTERQVNRQKKVIVDQYGGRNIEENTSISYSEHTDTDMIHPLNFAHALNRGEFYESQWASVRYELSISDVYGLLNHPLAHKPGIEMVIKEIEKGNAGWADGDTTFYVDSNDYRDGDQDTIIVTEYSGNFQYKGNYDDSALYWGIYSKKYMQWLLLGPSPWQRHPFWKMRTHPDPFGPYGVGPNSLLIPINVLKNTLFNQYVDFTNANLKYLYQVFPSYIRGGLRSLVDGLPGGLVQAINERSWNNGELIKPIRKESGGIPGMADAFQLLEKTEVEATVASSRKKSTEGVTNTATGEMQMAKQQDAAIASITSDMDHGLTDCIHQKLFNRMKYVTSEQRALIGQIETESPDVLYFPFELGGEAFDVEINRKSPMVEANKYMAFLTKVGEGMAVAQAGGGLINPQAVMEIYEEVGNKLGLDKTDRIWQNPNPPTEVGAGGQGGAGSHPQNMRKPAQPTPPGVAAGQNASAIV